MNTDASTTQKAYEFSLPQSDGATCIRKAWAKVPKTIGAEEQSALIAKLTQRLQKKNSIGVADTVLVAHYYVDGALQDLAIATGGCVADSLEMARFGKNHPAKNLIVAGVRFMGESAKILSPEKRVFMPDLEATCSLDLGCPASDFSAFCNKHPDRTVVVYANTSAEVKARADWMVTSSCALSIVNHLKEAGKKILWAPDRHLGQYIARETGADMLLWDGACIVHDEFRAEELATLISENPHAMVLVHPESPKAVVALAHVVGSTSALLKAVETSSANTFIVATDQGIVHRMRQLAPHKTFIPAPTAGNSATCKSCANCPWMAMNALQGVHDCVAFLDGDHPNEGINPSHLIGEIFIDEAIRIKAERCIHRMLDFTTKHPHAIAKAQHGFVPNIGAA